jgi:hypothetical protein
MNKMNRCYNCKFWATQDSGYSNYTVSETEVHCLKKHFEPIEESYSWKQSNKNPENDHEFFKQAEKCEDFVQETGTQICLDVDGDTTIEDFKEDNEVYQAAVDYGW